MKKFFKNKIEIVRQKFLLLFNYIQKKLSEIPKDKLLHFFYGSILVGFLNIFIEQHIVVFVYTGLFAVSKEIYDDIERDSPMDFLDFLFTLLPAIINFI